MLKLNPILQLANVVSTVAKEKNYSLRAVRQSDDEVGELVDGFNEMLMQIQLRDAALQAANDDLENRVAARTKELAQSVSLLNSALDATADGILVVDRDARVTRYNSQFVEMWRIPPERMASGDDEEALSFVVGQMKHGDAFLARVRELYAQPDAETRDVLELKDGRVFERDSKPQRLNGESVGRVWSFRDITARKRTDDAQQLIEGIVNAIPVRVFWKDRELVYLGCNTPFAQDAGFPDSSHIIGKTDYQLGWRDQAELYRRDDREVMASSNIRLLVEEPQTTPEGNIITLVTSKVPLRNVSGEIIGVLGTYMDVTPLKKAEAALAAERDLLRSLLDHAPDTIYFKDIQSRYLRASESHARHFGLTSVAEMIGKTDFDFFAKAEAQSAYEDEQEIVRTGRPIIGKIQKSVSKKEGRVAWSLTTKMPLRDKNGQIVGTFGISKDITDIKEAEAKLEQVNKQLLDTSRQAGMAEIATGVLHNVGNVLNSVNVSTTLVIDLVKRSKIGSVTKLADLLSAHEADLGKFFTADPLGQVVPGFVKVLSGQLVQEQTSLLAEFDSLRKNVEHIKEIVAMQQSYARVSGVRETVAAIELVEDALRVEANAMAKHGVEIVREFQSTPTVTLERHKVLQVLVNLIRNARQACAESGHTEKLVTVRVTSDESRFRIAIIDNGGGILPENLTRIFAHGFTTKKNGHGFGLHGGSLMAKELGGSLTVESEGLGRGATFVLDLPNNPKEAL